MLPPGQTLDKDISYARAQTLVPWWDTCLYVSGDYGDTLGVPSAINVPYKIRSHNKVLCIKMLVTSFVVTFCVLCLELLDCRK
jgi:hypothetical protein